MHQTAHRNAGYAADEAEAGGLQHVNSQHLRGLCAQAFHDCDGIHLLLQMGLNGRRNTQRANDQGDQTYEGKKCG